MSRKNDIAGYYSRIGSWAGYTLVLGRSQHAGYWQDDTRGEKEAQRNYLEKLSGLLNLRPSDRVLDAGSGQGYAARYLADTTDAHIIGITITPREVRVSNKLSKHMTNPPEFVLDDYIDTVFEDNYFDVIYETEALSHAKDMQAVMHEFYRILKPGGRVILFDYEIDNSTMTKERQELIMFLKSYAGGYGVTQQGPGQISRALKNAGFVDVSETDWSKYTKPTFDRLRKLAKPFAWIQPSSRMAPFFVNAVMATHGYSRQYEDGTFRYLVYQGRKRKK